jgi:cysteine desulfurase
MLELPEGIHNPSAVHSDGQFARGLIEESRFHVLRMLGLSSDGDYRLVFCSGATEANNSAILSLVPKILSFGSTERLHVISSAVEHPSVLEPLLFLQKFGVKLSLVRPDENGFVSSESVLDELRPETCFVSLMGANNETGVEFPVREVFSRIRALRPEIKLHSDWVQIPGKSHTGLLDLDADFLTFSGHKIGALSGIGALLLKRGLVEAALLKGGPQEQHYRAGTENVLGICSFGIAAEILENDKDRVERLRRYREELWEFLFFNFPQIIRNSPQKNSLANTLHISLPGIRADDLVVALDLAGLSVSSGAACASGKPTASHVLLAQGMSEEMARSSVRVSLRADFDDVQFERVKGILRLGISRFYTENSSRIAS